MSDDIAAPATAVVEEAAAVEVMTDWCVTCNYSGIRTPATATHVGDLTVHLCVECAEVYDDIRAENATI